MGRKDRRRRKRFYKKKFRKLEDMIDFDDFLDWDDLPKFRRKVFFDASAKPDTGLPIGLGIAAILGFLFLGGGPFIALAGFVLAMYGMARLTQRIFRGFKSIAEKTFQKFFESHKARKARLLKELDSKLVSDNDPRTHTLLRRIADLYSTLEVDVQEGRVTIAAKDVLQSADKVFSVCVRYLEQSYELLMAAKNNASGASLKLKKREQLIEEVQLSVEHLEHVVSEMHERALSKTTNELQSLRAELDETLRVAERVERRTEELTTPERSFEMLE